MAEKKEPRDEKLIEELYERLWWYTYEASEEEFDEKEVDAITRLLDVLEPVHDDTAYEPGADAALKRFWERYGEEEENAAMEEGFLPSSGALSGSGAEESKSEERIEEHLAEKTSTGEKPADEKSVEEKPDTMEAVGTNNPSLNAVMTSKMSEKTDSRRKWKKRLIRMAIGAAACVVLLISVNVGSYALRKKSFFEIVREEVGRTEITVTGNTEGFEENVDDAVECASWEEAEEIVGVDILKPTYVPEKYELNSLTVQDSELRKVIIAQYESEEGYFIRFRVNVYREDFSKDMMKYDQDWNIVSGNDSEIQFLCKEDIFEASFFKNRCVYYVLNNENIDTLKDVIKKME